MPRLGRAALWTLEILAALAFIAIGFGKFINPFWVAAFPRWGYSDGFRMLIGVLEMLGGALLALPRTATYAALLIDTILIGAAATLIVHHEKIFPPLFWLVIISIVGIARRRRAWRPSAPPIAATAGRV